MQIAGEYIITSYRMDLVRMHVVGSKGRIKCLLSGDSCHFA